MCSRYGCRRKRILFLFLCLTLCCAYIFLNIRGKKIENLRTCFIPTLNSHNENITLFEDILEAKIKPRTDRSIFFIESSCVRSGLAALTAR